MPHTDKQSPAAHYNNKIQENKTKSNLKFAIKCTTIQISLQLSFENSDSGYCYSATFFPKLQIK